MAEPPNADSWQRQVIHSRPGTAAWLAAGGPESDVVLSSRYRVLRNLQGFSFTHKLTQSELVATAGMLIGPLQELTALEQIKQLTVAERDFLVGARLLPPDFPWQSPGRCVLLDAAYETSAYTHEEDHLRIQSLTSGWSIKAAESATKQILSQVSHHLRFAQCEPWGFLAAGATNSGEGIRRSALFHLIGLATANRMDRITHALRENGMTVRGIFGEASRAIGAFVQMSMTEDDLSAFIGSGEFLIQEERNARQVMDQSVIQKAVDNAFNFVRTHRKLTLADSLRILAWARLAANLSNFKMPLTALQIDGLVAKMDFGQRGAIASLAEERADLLRHALQL